MSALRFAMGVPALRRVLADLMPRTALEAGFRFAPELISAGISASMIPGEDVGLGTRLGVGAEELGVGLGLSLLGNLGGRSVARRVWSGRNPRGQAIELPEGVTRQQARKNAVQSGIAAGDIAVMPFHFLTPRPYFNSQYDSYVNEQNKETALQTQEQQMSDEELINLLLAGGAIGGAAMSPLGSGSPRLIQAVAQ